MRLVERLPVPLLLVLTTLLMPPCMAMDVAPDTSYCTGSLTKRDCREDIGSSKRGAVGKRLKVPGAPAIERQVILAPREQTDECQARVEVTWMQMHTVASVDASVAYAGCSAATGTFDVLVKSADLDGVRRERRLTEQWQAQSSPIDLELEYPLDGDLDLISVRVRARPRTDCVCAEVDDSTAATILN